MATRRNDSESGKRPRLRLASLLLLTLVGLLLVALWPKRHRSPRAAPAQDPITQGRPAEPLRRAPPAAYQEPAPVIDEVRVEKQSVCEGEDNLITVRAHTENGTDQFLHYVIDGQRGLSAPVRLFKENGAVVGKHLIQVFGRNNVATMVELPTYEVRDCVPARLARLSASVQPNTWADYDFVVKVRPGPDRATFQAPASAKAFVGTRYEWSFGDGEKLTTTAATASHSYAHRAQESKFSDMLVSVDAFGSDGEKITARTSLSLVNTAFEALTEKHTVQLLLSLSPRFPQLDTSGRVVQQVQLWHTGHDPVSIDKISVIDYLDGRAQSERKELPVAQVLGTTSIPPGGAGVTTTVVLDTRADPQVFSRNYELTGRSADGIPASGTFSVMRPPTLPTREDNRLVSDPKLLRKILAAREILGKEFVTENEIARLENEGRLTEATATPAQ